MSVECVALEATWGRILNSDQLKRRGVSLGNRCYMHKREEVSIDYILLHCASANILWQLIFSLFGTDWVLHSSIKPSW